MNEKKRQRKLKLVAKLESALRLLSRRDHRAAQTPLFQKHYRPFLMEIRALEATSRCRECHGSGRDIDGYHPCGECGGAGHYAHIEVDDVADEGFEVACQKGEEEAKRLIAEARKGL